MDFQKISQELFSIYFLEFSTKDIGNLLVGLFKKRVFKSLEASREIKNWKFNQKKKNFQNTLIPKSLRA
jgi:hypothetical protein